MSLSLVDNSESREREEARRRDHRQLCALLADFLEEVRRPGRPTTVAEPPAWLSLPQVNQVSSTLYFCGRFQHLPGFTTSCSSRTGGHRSTNNFPTSP